jgi:uncharacterized protein with NAD-binding domain and iron-sulfur cluster
VVIIGAGLAGLTAALHLAARGIPPLVLEADSRWPGGRLAGGDLDTFEYGGRVWSFRPDHGVHALWGGYHNMRALLDRFLDIELNPSPGEEWINRWGREVRMIEAGNAVRSRWGRAGCRPPSIIYNYCSIPTSGRRLRRSIFCRCRAFSPASCGRSALTRLPNSGR